MATFVIIVVSLALLALIVYFGEIKFELRLKKSSDNNTHKENRTSLDHLSNTESTCEIALSFNDIYKFPVN